MVRSFRAVALLCACGLIAVACSGGSSQEPDAATVASAQATTTVEVDPLPAATSSTTTSSTTEQIVDETTTTTEPLGPVAPLTGVQVEAELTHPALLVKIDNHQNARPQWGLNAADVVYEEIVEGRITRLAAVFHSTNASPVGPVRSARTSDFDLLNDKNTPLFANSGGNQTTLSLFRSVNAVNANVNALPDLYYRERSRSAPHNLMTRTEDLISARGDDGGTPPAMFEYRRDGDPLPSNARPSTGVDIDYGARQIGYDWDEELGGWRRTQNGSAHVDADGVQVAPTNVVVQVIDYGRSVADPTSPEAITVGSGVVWVLVDGHIIEGTWQRNSAAEVATYTADSGEPIVLDPGNTWVALPRVGQSISR